MTAAYLRVEKYSGATPNVTAYEASFEIKPADITWNSAPQPTGAAWRVVVRIGYADTNRNGIIDISETPGDNKDYFDYHWWYETDTGKWAEKKGSTQSNFVKNGDTSAYTNPSAITWDGSYTSPCAYYVISFQE